MAITRRQFVTRLGALAAAAGMSQADVSKIVESFAYTAPGLGGTLGKPRVIWIHGAECTGCSTSVLGLFEDTTGNAVVGTSVTTGAAAGLAGILPTTLGGADLTLGALGLNVDETANGTGATRIVNIADVVIDVIDLQYHETIMGMGGDLAAQWLEDFVNYTPGSGSNPGDAPFVLVVEGALQDIAGVGAWGDTGTAVPWCSIGIANDGSFEHDMADTVVALASKSTCAAIVPIGQCATFGGYPGCKPPITPAVAGFNPMKSQTDAKGTYDYLAVHAPDTQAKVVNVPGCPTNPWWFTLTVVCLLVDLVNPSRPLGVLTPAGAPNPAAMDSTQRLKFVYGTPVHGPFCPRYQDYVNGKFATKPGKAGCLQKIGCKGPATNSLCGVHGWNAQQPQNEPALSNATWAAGVGSINKSTGGKRQGGHCTRAGHPCMACTEKGYPDSFVPFVARR